MERMEVQLIQRKATIDQLNDYYRGDHPLPEIPFRKDTQARYKQKYLQLLKKSRSNWMQLVVDAEAERMEILGFRFGDSAEGDKEAWQMWQRNLLDASSEQVHTESLKSGVSYVSVWPDDRGQPLLVPEQPAEVVVVTNTANRRQRLAGLKRWRDTVTGDWFATVYLPDALWKFVKKVSSDGSEGSWQPRRVPGEEWPLPNILQEVPIVPFPNRPDMKGRGYSEIAGVTDIQDRINATLFGRMLATEYAAAPQRWVTGMQLEEDDQGNPKLPFEVAFDRVWVDGNPETKFGQFDESDLAGYIKGVEQDIQHLAAITRTPPHYLLGQSGAFPSGESLKSTETGLVAKTTRQERYYGESWEDVVRLGFKVLGDDRQNDLEAETIWKDPEARTEGEHVDAALKKRGINVPDRQLWEDIGYTPRQIARFEELLRKQLSLYQEIGIPVDGGTPAELSLPSDSVE
jgi:hypothetical protein